MTIIQQGELYKGTSKHWCKKMATWTKSAWLT